MKKIDKLIEMNVSNWRSALRTEIHRNDWLAGPGTVEIGRSLGVKADDSGKDESRGSLGQNR